MGRQWDFKKIYKAKKKLLGKNRFLCFLFLSKYMLLIHLLTSTEEGLFVLTNGSVMVVASLEMNPCYPLQEKLWSYFNHPSGFFFSWNSSTGRTAKVHLFLQKSSNKYHSFNACWWQTEISKEETQISRIFSPLLKMGKWKWYCLVFLLPSVSICFAKLAKTSQYHTTQW